MIADLSHYNGEINWTLARPQLDLIIFRASVGANKDNKYIDYAKNCGVPYGVYHYVKAGTAAEATTEAKHFYACATTEGLRPLFFCADIEYEAQTDKTTYDVTKAFADTLRSLGAKKLGLYISQSRYNYAARDLYDFMWIPRWGSNTGKIEDAIQPKYPCELWQYTSKGVVSGINHAVDLNILNGDKPLSWFLEGSETSMATGSRFSAARLVEFCKGFVGQPYWYGTCVYKCTEKLMQKKAQQYPDAYSSSSALKRYRQNIKDNCLCADCIGLIKGFVWTNGGESVIESIGKAEPLYKNTYCSNGMPDKSANGMYNYAKSIGLDNGDVATIPEIPGLGLHKDGHAGVYIGNGLVVEERGGTWGCVISKLKERPWLHWYKIPCIDYGDTPVKPSVTPTKLGARTLKKGSVGDDVKELQRQLNALINANLKVDGDFGAATEEAVRKFQSKYNQTVDGIYGASSHKALMSALADQTDDSDQEQQEEPTPPAKPNTNTTTIKTTGNVNIRTGNGTQFAILTSVAINTKLNPICDAANKPLVSANGWYAVECSDQIGWVSGKYIG